MEAFALLDRHAGGRPDVWVESLDDALEAILSSPPPQGGMPS
jgi:hypothetical protein